MDMKLNGKHALVCGASQGIGQASAEALAELGARVTVVARSADKLSAVASQLDRINGEKNQWIAVDLSNESEIEARLLPALAKDPVQVLVLNAGGPPPGPLQSANPQAFIDGMRPHLVASQHLLRAALPGMREAGYGRIINIISTSVYEPIPGLGVSNTVRAAVAAWAKTLVGELGPDGITVNNVLPGFTATSRLDKIIEGKARQQDMSDAEVAEQLRSFVPLRRFAQPEEVANAVAFLASPAAAYISGVSLAVDGGRLKSL